MPFDGFPSREEHFTRVPDSFFRELLPVIQHPAEFKVTLYAFWFLEQIEDSLRYLQQADFIRDAQLMAGLGDSLEEAQAALQQGLLLTIQHGILLQTEIIQENGPQKLYFLNTARGRAAVKAIQNGEWRPTGDLRRPISLTQQRPNIFTLYETHIGPLTPMMADELREAEEAYPLEWIEEAVRIAVENNVRRWRYVAAILRSWKEEGRDERKSRGDSEKDRQRYVQGKFADFIEH